MKNIRLLPLFWVIALCSFNLIAQSTPTTMGDGKNMHEARFKVFNKTTKAPLPDALIYDQNNQELGKTDNKGTATLQVAVTSSDVFEIRYPGFVPYSVRLTEAQKKVAVYDVFMQPSKSVSASGEMMQEETELVKVYIREEPSTQQEEPAEEVKMTTAEKAASTQKSDPQQLAFAVQISASSKPVSDKKQLQTWEELGPVFVQQEGGLYKVRIGPYPQQEQAKATLLKVKARGKKDAFIVVQEGRDQHEPFNHLEQGRNVQSTPKASPPANENIPAADLVQGDYKVRLVSYLHPGGFNTKEVEQYGKLESYRKGDWTIMMIGGIKTAHDAKRIREQVKSKGFPDATVVVDRDGILEEVK